MQRQHPPAQAVPFHLIALILFMTAFAIAGLGLAFLLVPDLLGDLSGATRQIVIWVLFAVAALDAGTAVVFLKLAGAPARKNGERR